MGAHTNSPYDIASKRRKEHKQQKKSAQTNTVRGKKAKASALAGCWLAF